MKQNIYRPIISLLISILIYIAIIPVITSAVYATSKWFEYQQTLQMETEEISEPEETQKTYTDEDIQLIIDEIKSLPEPEPEPEEDFTITISMEDVTMYKVFDAMGQDLADIALNGPRYDFTEVPLDQDLIDVIIEECETAGIPIPVVLGVIQLESTFDPDALSGIHYGLMQLSKKYFPSDLSYADNLRYGIRYLSENYQKTGDIRQALDMYHCGHITGDTKYPNTVMGYAEHWAEVTNCPLT